MNFGLGGRESRTPKRNLTEGDIVLMMKEDSPCGQWPLTVVEKKTFPDSNGHVRQVIIRTANQNRSDVTSENCAFGEIRTEVVWTNFMNPLNTLILMLS